VVPHDEDLKYRILYEAHDTALSGHLGREKTYSSVSRTYWWSKMYKWTSTYVRTCETCQGSDYHIFPVVHVSKLKLVRTFPDRPDVSIPVDESDRVDFDEALLPEDSWEGPLGEDEFEVERITDIRTGRRTRYGRIHRNFAVHWKGYEGPTWVDEADLNCGALLREFERERANRSHFEVMQSHEEEAGDSAE